MAEEKEPQGFAETLGQEVGKNFDKGAEVLAEGAKLHARAFSEGAKTVGSGIKDFADRVGGSIKKDFTEDIADAKGVPGKAAAIGSAAANVLPGVAPIKFGLHATGFEEAGDKAREVGQNTLIRAVGGEVPSEKKTPEKSDEGFAHRPAPKVGEGSEASKPSFVGAAGALAGGLQKDAEKKQVDFLKNLDHDVIDQLADTAKHKPEDFRSLAQEVLSKGMHDQKLKDAGKSVDDAVKNSGKDDMEPIRPEKDSSKDMSKSKESSAMKLDGPEIG